MKNIQSFKDEIVDTMENPKMIQKVLNSGPIYFFANIGDDKLTGGQLGSIKEIPEFINTVRSLSKGYDYAGLAMLSLVADLKAVRGRDQLQEEIESLESPEQLINFLKNKDLLAKSISIRIESRDKDEDNSILSLVLKNDKLGEVIELNDGETSDVHGQNPFGDGILE